MGWAASAGSADGTLIVDGDVVAPVGESLTLLAGGARDSPRVGSMSELVVRSSGVSAVGSASTTLKIGWATGGASAVGHVDATGDVGYFPTIDVGVVGDVGLPVTGNSDGTLIVRNGALTAGTLRVGVTEGTGAATGHLHLDHALAQLDGSLELGDGATLELGIDGTTRGTRYGEIDAPTALLDGILRLSFTATPAAGTMFDLIVSGSADGITGAFDLVEILGIDPALIQLGVELIPTPIGPVEAFRARVVPEPGVGLLLGLGLALLGIGRGRTHTAAR